MQLMGHVVMGQCFFKLQRVVPQMVFMACHQVAGWQSLYDVGMLRVDIRGKGAVSITFAKQVVRQEKPDLIESGGIKHAADEAGRLYRKE